jgi:hypothetical protein
MTMSAAINKWEDEGGAPPPSTTLKGTDAQVEWAERIQRTVDAEFDRVAAAFRSVALKPRSAPIRKPFLPYSQRSALRS